MPDRIVVVGGGIVGLCSALALQREGHPTVVIDPQGPALAASWGNAGHIAIEQVVPLASFDTIRTAPRRLTIAGGALALPPRAIRHWLPFALRLARHSTPSRHGRGREALGALLAGAMPAWRRLASSLPGRSLLVEDGHIVVWHDETAAARGIAAWQAADIGTARCRPATSDERRALLAVMRREPAGALVFENTGQIADPFALRQSLTDAFLAAGGVLKQDTVRGITVAGGAATVSLASGEVWTPKALLVAAGVESGRLLSPLGLRVPMIAERGYHVQSAAHGWPEALPPVVFEERSMIVTRFRSGLRAAGFVEFGPAASPPDPRRWQALERHVAALGLPFEDPATRWMGARPTLPDYLPAIGRAAVADNLFYAFGHQHLGLTLGPLTGELAGALIAGRAEPNEVRPFTLDRFGAAKHPPRPLGSPFSKAIR